ncbi:MAG: hypothetical protein K0S36_1418 [Nitrosospira multiformis]|nr:hypothetical protein [Nitrosospira multiformis]
MLLLPAAGCKSEPAVERSRPPFAASAGFHSKISGGVLNRITEPDLLIGNETGQAHAVSGLLACVCNAFTFNRVFIVSAICIPFACVPATRIYVDIISSHAVCLLVFSVDSICQADSASSRGGTTEPRRGRWSCMRPPPVCRVVACQKF